MTDTDHMLIDAFTVMVNHHPGCSPTLRGLVKDMAYACTGGADAATDDELADIINGLTNRLTTLENDVAVLSGHIAGHQGDHDLAALHTEVQKVGAQGHRHNQAVQWLQREVAKLIDAEEARLIDAAEVQELTPPHDA